MQETEVVDTTQQVVTETKVETPSPEELAVIETAKAGATQLKELLAGTGYESVEDLAAALSSGKDLSGLLGDQDLQGLLDNKALMDRYEEAWAIQDKAKEGEDKTTEDEVAALTKRLDDLISGQNREKQVLRDKADAKSTYDSYESGVNSFMVKQETIPEEYRPFLAEFSGVGNPFNEIDISDTPQVRAMLHGNVKKVNDFAQVVIKLYRAGKLEVPAITPATPVDTTPKREPFKNVHSKETRAAAIEFLKERLAQKESG